MICINALPMEIISLTLMKVKKRIDLPSDTAQEKCLHVGRHSLGNHQSHHFNWTTIYKKIPGHSIILLPFLSIIPLRDQIMLLLAWHSLRRCTFVSTMNALYELTLLTAADNAKEEVANNQTYWISHRPSQKEEGKDMFKMLPEFWSIPCL